MYFFLYVSMVTLFLLDEFADVFAMEVVVEVAVLVAVGTML